MIPKKNDRFNAYLTGYSEDVVGHNKLFIGCPCTCTGSNRWEVFAKDKNDEPVRLAFSDYRFEILEENSVSNAQQPPFKASKK